MKDVKTFGAMIDKFNPFSSNEDTRPVNSISKEAFAQEVRDVHDMLAVQGDVVGSSGAITPLTITARDTIFEPTVIERMLAFHAPYKRTVNPLRLNFNASGQLPAYSNLLEANLLDAVKPDTELLLGYAFRVVLADNQLGEGTFGVKTTAGIEASFTVNSTDDDAVVVVLQAAKDVQTACGLSTAFVPTDTVLNFETFANETAVNNQFYFDYSARNTYTVNGSNVNVHVYPLYMTRSLAAVLAAAVTADRLADLPSIVAQAYRLGS